MVRRALGVLAPSSWRATFGTKRWKRAVLLVLALVGVACDSQEQEKKEEWARLDRVIDVLRASANEDKAARLAELEQTGCAHFCALRFTCLSAYRLHTETLVRVALVRSQSQRGDEKPLTRELREAEQQLGEARILAQRCTDEQAEVARRFGD